MTTAVAPAASAVSFRVVGGIDTHTGRPTVSVVLTEPAGWTCTLTPHEMTTALYLSGRPLAPGMPAGEIATTAATGLRRGGVEAIRTHAARSIELGVRIAMDDTHWRAAARQYRQLWRDDRRLSAAGTLTCVLIESGQSRPAARAESAGEVA